MSQNILNLTDDSFKQDVLDSDTPVLVDFWAPWCQPCRMIAPILEELAPSYQGKVQIAKINIDENSRVPSKYGVRSIPTLILFKDGEIKATQVGALGKMDLQKFIDSSLG